MQPGMRATRGETRRADSVVSLRRFPYPYRAAVAICSDIDGTRTVRRFLAIQEFLNSTEETLMGPGVGLEIGNSFFPYPDGDSFGLFSSRRRDREVIEAMIDAGFIDCFHSWGYGAHSHRDQALRALEELSRNGLHVQVWTDHSLAPSNFGKDTTRGMGDVRGSPYYHADATLAYGVRFAWMGRGSAIVGQGVPSSLRGYSGVFDRHHPRETGRKLAKEVAKSASAHAGVGRFALHAGNQFVRVCTLADGQHVYEFQRCCPHWRGPAGANSQGLAYVLRPQTLQTLVDSGGTMVVYTHLGIGPEEPPYLPSETRAALRHLAAVHQAGRLYVTTTSRLLTYYVNHRGLLWSHATNDRGETVIHIGGVADPLVGRYVPPVEALQGITFWVPDSLKAQIVLGARLLPRIERNQPDETGRASVTIPRTRLSYPRGPF